MPTTAIFNDEVATSRAGTILARSLRALLLRRPDLYCTLQGAFDGMTDSIERVERDVDASWVIANLLDRSSHTRRAFVTHRHGVDVISVATSSYDVLVSDAEYQRRCLLLATLPAIDPPDGLQPHQYRPGILAHFQTPRGMSQGPHLSITLSTLLSERTRYLDTLKDPLTFDNEVENLRRISAPDALAHFLHTRGLIHLVDFARA